MKTVYGYIRISDKWKQEQGASLHEQKRILKEYADRNNLNIILFYEEKKTAAERGRPLFNEMMRNLKNGLADGVVIHKIDRSARNLHDWASVGDLIDNDIDVHFAHESLNLKERGGRLSADIQAVMASDYIRNLKQETLKGMYGRLKQGFYPWNAPMGYVNNGSAKLKTIDPIQGELVKELFELYSTGEYSLLKLSKEMEKRGLRNKSGNRVCKNGIVLILKNPFYIGIMKVKNEEFEGKHKALISTSLFNQVQMVFKDRKRDKRLKHYYLFRRLIRCENCNYIMSGERQKGHVYYRCRINGCGTKTIREDTVELYIKNILKTIHLTKKETDVLTEFIAEYKNETKKVEVTALQTYNLQIKQLEVKEKRLLDAYLENTIEKKVYEERKKEILFDIRELKEAKETKNYSKESIFTKIENIVELCKNPLKAYILAKKTEKREMIKTMMSNLTIDCRKALFTMVSPYNELTNRDFSLICSPP